MEKGEKITIVVPKRTPSLNTLLRWNPWETLKQKKEMTLAVADAISSELSRCESGSATQTTLLADASISLMRSGLQELYLKMTQKRSSSRSGKKRSPRIRKKKRGWR